MVSILKIMAAASGNGDCGKDRLGVLRPSKARLVLFAFGDFGFNLYWQSVMLFLLFYYTDTLGFGIGWAAATYMVASIWDGIIGFVIGVEADRRGQASNYRRALIWGAIPLGISFVLAYLPLGGTMQWNLALLFAAHMLFRTFYAWVNIPYLAMTARISEDSRDRAFVAGLRMIFGTLAAIVVSLFTIDIGEALIGTASDAYLGGAIAFAVLASIILICVGATYRDVPTIAPAAPIPIGPLLKSLARNRSFVMLSLAMVTMIIAVTMVSKSVLYYFKYFIHDEAAGRLALAQMMATGLVAIPAWMLVARLFSVRVVWIAAVLASVLLLILFSLVDMDKGRYDADLSGRVTGRGNRLELRGLGTSARLRRLWRSDDRKESRGNGVRPRVAPATNRHWHCDRATRLGLFRSGLRAKHRARSRHADPNSYPDQHRTDRASYSLRPGDCTDAGAW